MEVLPKDPILKFPSDIINIIRKTYNLDKPGAMDTSVDILELWLKKQEHFLTKEFSREYLERCIIINKGSIERVKERLERMCTARTLMPDFFVDCNVKDFKNLDKLTDVVLPKLTNDYHRVYLLHNCAQELNSGFFLEYYIRMIHFLEYMFAHDYSSGFIVIYDFRQLNLMEMVKKIDVVQLSQVANIFLKSFSLRVKAIHFISPSKVVNIFVSLVKQVLSDKFASRIQVHKELDTLHEHIEKDILPEEYGGNEISFYELHKKWLDLLGSENFMEYMKKMNAAKTNETVRRSDDFNNQYMGMPGTFRTLNVD